MKKTLLLFLLLCGSPSCAGCPGYEWYVKQQNHIDQTNALSAGKSQYLTAEQNRNIRVLEAQATLDSSKLLADAEVERAKGVAAANRIIGSSLHDNEAYLRWLWIKELNEAGNSHPQVIYVPTEAGLPILEAGHRPN
jgi:regulator of protease activity HflC (stomatin/prohibitin superfamily)